MAIGETADSRTRKAVRTATCQELIFFKTVKPFRAQLPVLGILTRKVCTMSKAIVTSGPYLLPSLFNREQATETANDYASDMDEDYSNISSEYSSEMDVDSDSECYIDNETDEKAIDDPVWLEYLFDKVAEVQAQKENEFIVIPLRDLANFVQTRQATSSRRCT